MASSKKCLTIHSILQKVTELYHTAHLELCQIAPVAGFFAALFSIETMSYTGYYSDKYKDKIKGAVHS
jgi:DNA-binding ferritin-like protein (Dps family)